MSTYQKHFRKECNACGKIKPESQFYVDHIQGDDLDTICKECRKSYMAGVTYD
jgi:hypothetical protein